MPDIESLLSGVGPSSDNEVRDVHWKTCGVMPCSEGYLPYAEKAVSKSSQPASGRESRSGHIMRNPSHCRWPPFDSERRGSFTCRGH